MLMGGLHVEREDEQGVRWQLEAPRGLSRLSDDTLTLTGGVVVTRGADVTLETDELTIDANTHLASSSSQASIISARGVTTGSQLQIDFRGGTAKLRGDVASSFSKGTSEK